MTWRNPEIELPEHGRLVLVAVRTKFDRRWRCVAEYIGKHQVLAEDFLDQDCSEDFVDVGDGGLEYAPAGWYEFSLNCEPCVYIGQVVEWWMPLPDPPPERGAVRRTP